MYPGEFRSLKDVERYIDNLYARQYVRLERDSLRPNASKQELKKLCLNYMWGKLTEKHNRTETNLISKPFELNRFLATPVIEVVNLVFASVPVVCAS